MTNFRAANAYRKVDLESAPKDQILDRLFARFLVDVATGRSAITAGDIQTKGNALNHAAAIIVELRAALDPQHAPELCENLVRLYDYANERLVFANMKMSVAALDDATKVMSSISDAFLQARGAR